jgi:hypothetical protein
MHKPGTDPDHVEMSDVLCDFCRREWVETRPMVEGHHGSVICGDCLRVAFATVVNAGMNTAAAGYKCTMCLENRDDDAWESPAYPEAAICRRCIKMGAVMLERDEESGWRRPEKVES